MKNMAIIFIIVITIIIGTLVFANEDNKPPYFPDTATNIQQVGTSWYEFTYKGQIILYCPDQRWPGMTVIGESK